jgi:hypothetical protein
LTTAAAIKNATWTTGRVGTGMSFAGNATSFIECNVPLNVINNTFTVALWVKPTTNITLKSESTSGSAGEDGQKYVTHPRNGGSPGSAGCSLSRAPFECIFSDCDVVGLSVGTNGIQMFERSDAYFACLLSHQLSISGWTHIAVVYNNSKVRVQFYPPRIRTDITDCSHPSMSMESLLDLAFKVPKLYFSLLFGSAKETSALTLVMSMRFATFLCADFLKTFVEVCNDMS